MQVIDNTVSNNKYYIALTHALVSPFMLKVMPEKVALYGSLTSEVQLFEVFVKCYIFVGSNIWHQKKSNKAIRGPKGNIY